MLLSYSFAIGGDGNIYEGRGWNRTGAHAKGWNSKSIGIVFIGDFTGNFNTILSQQYYNIFVVPVLKDIYKRLHIFSRAMYFTVS